MLLKVDFYNLLADAYSYLNRERIFFFLIPAVLLLVYRVYIISLLSRKYEEQIHIHNMLYKFNNIELKLTMSKKAKDLKYAYNKSFFFFLGFLLGYGWFTFFEWLVAV